MHERFYPAQHHLANTSDIPVQLRHLGFWKQLSRDDVSPSALSEAEAGLLLLRYYEFTYLSGIASSRHAATNLKTVLRRIVDGKPRKILAALYADMMELTAEDRPVPASVLTYAAYLEQGGQWPLARDVWDAVVFAWRSQRREETVECVDAYLHRAVCARRAGLLEAAIQDFEHAQRIADHHAFTDLYIQATIGGAGALADNGAVEFALPIIENMVLTCRRPEFTMHEIDARLTYGHVLKLRGAGVRALLEYGHALKLADQPRQVEPALASIASCAADCGYYRIAIDSFELIASTAEHPAIRALAWCHLLEIYTWMGNVAAFERTSRRLHDIPYLDARTDAYARLYMLRGRYAFKLSQDIVAEYRDGAKAIERLGVPGAREQVYADLHRLDAGEPLAGPPKKNTTVPLALKPLEKVTDFMKYRYNAP